MNRREFLKVAGTSLTAVICPRGWIERSGDAPSGYFSADKGETETEKWPKLMADRLPARVREVLGRIKPCEISAEGFLWLAEGSGQVEGKVPLARTRWNQEKSTSLDRLLTDWSWGIVLHWYGEPENFDKTVTGYLRGFDSLRLANNYETRTSAHFLVGDGKPVTEREAKENVIGILQTQAPDLDGTPFVASHLRPLNYELHLNRQQYFVKAFDALGYAEAGVHSILQEFYDGPKIDPGWRTIAIEITGFNFDDPKFQPGNQQVANVLEVIWAVMKRYKITALDVLGHQELELDKPDPGKLFMATIRYLLGVKALVEEDEQMNQLVFGRFLLPGVRMEEAVRRYFKFVRDYLVLVSRPVQVYTWEKSSQFWLLWDQLPGTQRVNEPISTFDPPLEGKIYLKGDQFLEPGSHSGLDIYPEREQAAKKQAGSSLVRLVAEGECLFAGRNTGACAGKMAIFRHRHANGAEILSIYSHLSELADLRVGQRYPRGYGLGKIISPQVFMERYLHFSVAYGATWDADLSQRADLPLNASSEWIQQRFMDPLIFLEKESD